MIDREIDKRQQIDSDGHPVNTAISLVFVSHSLYGPQTRNEGEGKRLLYQDTKSKQSSYLLIPKASSNHTLGQSLLLVGTL